MWYCQQSSSGPVTTSQPDSSLISRATQSHPGGTVQQALRELPYTHADHMYAVADSVRMDLLREQAAAGASAGPGTGGGQ